MTGLAVDATGFEVLVGQQRVGARRMLDRADVDFLAGLTARYVRAVHARSGAGVFVGLGRELFGWLEGDGAQLGGLLERAGAPLVFEVRTVQRSPSEAGWALLRAPFELLAHPGGGYLAADELTRFTVVRRLGPIEEPPKPDGFRLGVAFMASSPRGQHELDFEAEEAAILRAVGDSRVDLLVEDTGDPEQLGRRLAEVGGMPAVHVSCHGHNNWRMRPGDPGVPVLMMENDVGDDRPTTAADLTRLLTVGPRLLMVSACLTATGTDAAGGGLTVAHSLATALVTAGVPAVIGWDGSVDDQAATEFAQHLYRGLANGADVAVAVGDARRALLLSEDPVVRTDWHLARLWLGPAGGGRLVAGTRKRSLVSATHGTKTFLDRKRHVPVAAPEMFVGRRPELQRALRALRSGEHAGVLLHGQGRLGKSSLAARIADRCPDRAVAVVFGDYSALGILDAVADAVRTNPAARGLIEQHLPSVRERPDTLETVLIDLLSGPCAQAGAGQRPLLLIIDDLEQILVADPAGPHRVAPEHAPVVAAVLRAFDPSETDSRLLVTSRFTFRLDGLEERLEAVQLRPLSGVAQRKLQRRQQALTPPERQVERAELAGRALAVSRGNPGLQDLIGLRLVYGQQVPLARAEAAMAGMEAYLHQGELPSDAEVRAFLENLALDTLVQEAGPANRDLLRAVTLFDLPVPEPVIAALAERVGGSPARLQGLGLLDAYEDLYDPTRLALAANPLAAGRLRPLTPSEQAELAASCASVLLTEWGGTAPRGRASQLDLLLTRLGLLADDPTVVAEAAAGGIDQLRGGRAEDASRLGQDAIALLDRHRHAVSLWLLRQTADAALTSGDGDTGDALLERAVRQAESGGQQGIDPLDHARVLGERARRLITRGEPQQAEPLLRQAHHLFTTTGSEREAATVMGEIAGIAYRRGDYDEAVRIRREIELPVYERLGEVRSTAVCWGRIADIAYDRGDYDEALRVRREIELPVYERLGDARSTAITWGKIADIAYHRGDYDEALRIRREIELPVYERLGDVRSTTICWGQIANIAYHRGDYDEALRIRHEIELPVYERLGEVRSTTIAWGQIADIAYQRGDYEEALRIRREVQLPVYEHLGDTRSTAITWGEIADIAYHRGDYDEALRIRREIELPVYEHLGDVRSTTITWGQIADIAYHRGDYDEALRIRHEIELPVYEHLGDVRSTTITWGKIADIAYQRGDYDEALRIRREVQLPVYERLGDTRSTAVCSGKIADIAYQRGDYDEALRIRHEIELPVYERLGDTRSTAVCSGKIADIAYQRGDYDEALRIRREIELPVYERLGDTRSTAVCWGQIADIAHQRGDYDEALRIRHEIELPVYERLGDTRSTTIAWGKIADIAHHRGDYDEALRIRREIELPVFERLGDVRSTAVTWGQIADIAYQRGDYDEALRIRREVQLPVYERLGEVRSTAICWGKIADISAERGDWEEAADLQRRRLEVNKRLGDLDGIAAANWALAQIDLAQQDYQSAIPRVVESFQILRHLQRADGIATVGLTLAQLLVALGLADEAGRVLDDSLAAATTLGRADLIERINELRLNLPEEGNEQK